MNVVVVVVVIVVIIHVQESHTEGSDT